MLIENAASQARQEARFALTSGSTARPKRIFYTERRLRSVKLAYQDVYVRSCWGLGIGRKSLYIFSSFGKDDSLTSLLLEESNFPHYLSTLQAPYRIECHPAIQDLASFYGANAVRLWILAMANPGVLYSTNPSTLSKFLDELAANWQRSSQLIRDFCNQPGSFDPAIGKIAQRLDSRGSSERLMRIATIGRRFPWRPAHRQSRPTSAGRVATSNPSSIVLPPIFLLSAIGSFPCIRCRPRALKRSATLGRTV